VKDEEQKTLLALLLSLRLYPLDLLPHTYKLFTSRLADFCILNNNWYIHR